jgi:hypothetical protein
MSMSPEQENFDQLRRLLALKRHEQPPPGYFDNFSREVISRIRLGEASEESLLERLAWEAPWLRWLLNAMEGKPILAGAFGAAVCGLLVVGLANAERPITGPMPLALGTVESLPMETPQPPNSLLDQSATTAFSSTEGIIAASSGPTLFQPLRGNQKPLFENVGYTVPGEH